MTRSGKKKKLDQVTGSKVFYGEKLFTIMKYMMKY